VQFRYQFENLRPRRGGEAVMRHNDLGETLKWRKVLEGNVHRHKNAGEGG